MEAQGLNLKGKIYVEQVASLSVRTGAPRNCTMKTGRGGSGAILANSTSYTTDKGEHGSVNIFG